MPCIRGMNFMNFIADSAYAEHGMLNIRGNNFTAGWAYMKMFKSQISRPNRNTIFKNLVLQALDTIRSRFLQRSILRNDIITQGMYGRPGPYLWVYNDSPIFFYILQEVLSIVYLLWLRLTTGHAFSLQLKGYYHLFYKNTRKTLDFATITPVYIFLV